MRKLLIFLTVVLIAIPAAAQWRRAGLFGADVRALIADPSDPDTLFLGTSGGEVYVSTDGAKSWTSPRNGIPFPGYVVDNLVIDREGRLWAACWGLWDGGVIAVSSDRGKTWIRRDAGLEDLSVRAIAIDPNDANFILAGGLTGVFRSTDGGASWSKLSDQINVESLAIDPRTRDRIYVGTWRQGWRTDDGGTTWSHIANGMVLDTDMFSITIDEKDPDNMWVATCGWVYNTTNRGDLWTRYRDGFTNRRIHDIEIDPCDPDRLFAGSVAGLYRSDDRGKTWYVVSDEGLVINTIVLHPQRPNRIILGSEGDGVYISNDQGKTYARSSEGLHNVRVTAIVADPGESNRVYASVAFGGAASGIYQSDDAGKAWTKVSKTKLPEVLSLTIAPDADAQPKFIAGTEKGFFTSSDAAEWLQSEPSTFPIRVDKIVRFNRTRLFAATAEGVFTSRDAGLTWYRLAGADMRAVDVVIGSFADRRALFALTSNGLLAFDGAAWSVIDGAPKGRTIAVRGSSIYIAGSTGVKAGRIAADRKWQAIEAPDAQHASVYGASSTLFLTSRAQREILVGGAEENEWLQLVLPSRNTEVTSVAPDPFAQRFYVGTLGEGVFVYEGKTAKYVAKHESAAPASAAAGSQ
ncbi:MAG TPA: hypothetical protein VMU84_18165 [Thermoanaerobaculia bacterium]|nr:hypothetical protein [Thermoanaerobaculia bacterium]